MKKATQKIEAPSNLGVKRSCPQCGTKFYDFGKETFSCPKCQTSFDADTLNEMVRSPDLKKPKEKEKSSDPLMQQADEMVSEEAETYESVDDLTDEDEDIVEDIDVDEEDQDT